MNAGEKKAAEALCRLLHYALVEIRAEASEAKSKTAFHLADLFHNVVLDLPTAAEGKIRYEDLLRGLEEGARAKGCEKWIARTLALIDTAPVASDSVAAVPPTPAGK